MFFLGTHVKYHIRKDTTVVVKSHSIKEVGHSSIKHGLRTLPIFSSETKGPQSGGSADSPMHPRSPGFGI